MIKQPLVSVIIPCYNAARFVVPAVESVLAQSYRPVEVIVVDDGSTDDTARVLEPYQKAIRYIGQPNGGPAGARNRGLAQARGELIAFLDADDAWLPDKLALQVRSLKDAPGAALVHSDVYYYDEATGVRTRRDFPRGDYAGHCYLLLFQGSRVTFSSVVVRRECLEQVGGFDETIRHASVEDYDLLLRVARRFAFAYTPEPLVVYRLHDGNGSGNLARMVFGELLVIEKALRNDPDLPRVVGARKVRERLFALHYGLGYLAYDREDLGGARRHFLRAALTGQSEGALRSSLYYLACWAPPPLLRRLRSIRRTLFPVATP